nr:hypothetical protein HUO10_005276 [Paraburkholderia busanensis]
MSKFAQLPNDMTRRCSALTPYVPQGATIMSITSAFMRLNPYVSLKHVKKLLLGTEDATPLSYMGAYTDALSKAIGVGQFSDRCAILHNFTLWPFYAYCLPKAMREDWLTVPDIGNMGHLGYFLATRANRRLGKGRPHLCLDCIESDLTDFGIAHWHVEHQIPGIDHCPYHCQATICSCHACGQAFSAGWEVGLPRSTCAACGAVLTSPTQRGLSSAYMDVLAMVSEMFGGNWSLLTPEARYSCYWKLLRTQHKSEWQQLAPMVCNALLHEWDAPSLEVLSSQTDAMVSCGTVERALTGGDTACDPMLHLLLRQVVPRMVHQQSGVVIGDHKLGTDAIHDAEPRSNDSFRLPASKECELQDVLRSVGIPVSVIDELAAGRCWTVALRKVNSSRTRGMGALNRVPWLWAYLSTIRRAFFADILALADPKKYSHPPSVRQIADRRKIFRAKLATYLKDHPNLSRERLRKLDLTARNWFYRMDRAYLDRVLPKKGHYPRAHYRKLITDAIVNMDNPKRKDLWRTAHTATQWIFSHDRKWLDRVLPRITREKRARK